MLAVSCLRICLTEPLVERRNRSRPYRNRPHGRYWWFHANDYEPPVFSLLSDEEWAVMDRWYRDGDERQSAGEANIPTLSTICGFIEGSGVKSVVQLGHYEGFSTLLLGFAMRRMGFKHGLFSIDIDPNCSAICERWVAEAGLKEYVSVVTASSDDLSMPARAQSYLEDDISAIFVDSSHQYGHSLRELDLWYTVLRPFGFIFMHDVSIAAADLDKTNEGGVGRAFSEWVSCHPDASCLMLNQDVIFGTNPKHGHELVFKDGCGLGIIHKRSLPVLPLTSEGPALDQRATLGRAGVRLASAAANLLGWGKVGGDRDVGRRVP
jgi:predicted O-methyltransferase YrrM